MINRIYLHWTAGRYDQFFNDYHICIDGDGGVHRMADLETKLAHTWHRNSNAVGIALCCCYGAKVYKIKPTPPQAVPPSQGEGLSVGVVTANADSPSIGRGWADKGTWSGGVGYSDGYFIAWGSYPPTEIQIVSMANCVAEICKEYGLPINEETVMTHAEIATIDGYGIEDKDPDLRWDLLRLPGHSNAKGGDVVRQIARILGSREERR